METQKFKVGDKFMTMEEINRWGRHLIAQYDFYDDNSPEKEKLKEEGKKYLDAVIEIVQGKIENNQF